MGDATARIVKIEVPCELTGTPGLVVHRRYGGAGYTVTHAPTGKCIPYAFERAEQAMAAAAALGGLGNWNIDGVDSVVETFKSSLPAIHAVCEAAGGTFLKRSV